ncbi:MAG: 2,3-bisphosphoglycerate-independent phosphoglycerate mutase [Eubacteriaceae bacterium]|jgi:2,3-bisphosphoglycerate-independent phosphoglycerate mutase|nr:2,3-bisphosphoglycerate-independent phosphoglycerate mutase [Eubacteriaceae bacterium]
MRSKALLLILDGFGLPKDISKSAVSSETAPFLYSLRASQPYAEIQASGAAVGLPEGQMGNSEVGHLNLGAGRVVYQGLTRIEKAIEDGSFFHNEAVNGAIGHALETGGALHLMGLVSDGGVHSMSAHAAAIVGLASKKGLKRVYLHCFLDGRDTPPASGLDYVKRLEESCGNAASVATVSGRYWAMDRDNRWERIRKAYDAIVGAEAAPSYGSAADCILASYGAGVTDEFVLPAKIADSEGAFHPLRDSDSAFFFNFRPDRAREMSMALMDEGFEGFERKMLKNVYFASMSSYDDTFSFAHAAFADAHINGTLGEAVSSAGLRQLRIAETEKYAHVTYFFSGGREEPFPGEDRELVASPKVATYDLKPEMSVFEVAELLAEKLETGIYDLVVCNFANCDMVGHTGLAEAAKKAVSHVDRAAEQAVQAALKAAYAVVVCADHGNAEKMETESGEPFTAHTTFNVPMTAISPALASIRPGRLSDIAPTILELMGLEKPQEMSGNSLAAFKPV